MKYDFGRRSSCPACGSTEFLTLAQSPLDDEPLWPMLEKGSIPLEAVAGREYEAAECRDCQTLFQVQVGGARVLTQLYEVWAASEPSDEWRDQCEWFVANPRQSRDGHQVMAVASMLGRPARSLRTLDYGMGYGLWARIASELGCASFGFDFADDRTHAAEKDGVATLTLDQIRAERFDLINMEQVLEHVTDVADTLALLVGSLRPGGVLCVSVPAQHRVRVALDDLSGGRKPSPDDLNPLWPLQHVNAFTVAGLRRLGQRSGVVPATPTRIDRLAFLRHGGVSLSSWVNSAKELARPFTPMEGRRNLAMWFKKPA